MLASWLVPAAMLTLNRPPLGKLSLPCVGFAATSDRELIVVGTAHTPCRSASEVTAVISKARPDVVVIELDQERFERLMQTPKNARRFGADFAAAAEAADAIDAPIILGDSKARDTIASLRAPGPIADARRLENALTLAWRGIQRELERDQSGLPRVQSVDLLGTLREDPAKLLPLLGGLWWSVLLSAFTSAAYAVPRDAPTAPWVTDLQSWAATVGALGVLALGARVFDELLIRRDDVLAGSALRGLELADGLRSAHLGQELCLALCCCRI